MTGTFTSYSMITRDLSRSIASVLKQPAVQRETGYYLQNIGSVKSADEFVSDRRLVTYAMTAFGLGDMAYAKAFVRKILAEGHEDSSAFVNKLADKRYLEFAKTFDFKRYGGAATAFGSAQQGVADKYVRQALETQSGSGNEGVRLALYFERNASKLNSVTEILTDKAMTQVVKTVLRLPEVFSLVDIDKQIATLDDRLKIDNFRDPAKLTLFIKRFASLWDLDKGGPGQNPAAILFSQPRQLGLSDAIMASLAKLNSGR